MTDGQLSILDSFLMSSMTIPQQLWQTYVDYLWNYAPGSVVSKISSTMYILAIMLITPFIILTLLDVSSYVIARTLGVVDSTKASTNDKRILKGPILQVTDVDAQTHVLQGSDDKRPSDMHLIPNDNSDFTKQKESPALFVFSPSETNLHISSSGLFSPPTSRPSSPPIRSNSFDTKSNSSSTISDVGSYILIGDKLEQTTIRRRDVDRDSVN